MLRRMAREQGGVVLKLIGWLAALAVLASAGLFAYVRTQEPLALGDVKVGANGAAAMASPTETVHYRPGGQVYVATFIRNDGRFAVTLQGLGAVASSARTPYIPTQLLLGTGMATNPDTAASFSATSLPPKSGVGVLIVYTTNPVLVCGELPAHPESAKPARLPGVPIRYTTYGIDQTQTLTPKGLPEVAPPTRSACQAVRTSGSG
jgi:hypothetical protein